MNVEMLQQGRTNVSFEPLVLADQSKSNIGSSQQDRFLQSAHNMNVNRL